MNRSTQKSHSFSSWYSFFIIHLSLWFRFKRRWYCNPCGFFFLSLVWPMHLWRSFWLFFWPFPEFTAEMRRKKIWKKCKKHIHLLAIEQFEWSVIKIVYMVQYHRYPQTKRHRHISELITFNGGVCWVSLWVSLFLSHPMRHWVSAYGRLISWWCAHQVNCIIAYSRIYDMTFSPPTTHISLVFGVNNASIWALCRHR